MAQNTGSESCLVTVRSKEKPKSMGSRSPCTWATNLLGPWGLKKMKFMGETILKPFLEVNHSWSSLTSKDWIEISPSISPSISLGNLRWIGELGRFVQVISSYDHLLTGKIALAFHNLRKDSRRYFYWRVKRRVLQDMMLCGLVYNHSNPIPNDRPQNGTPKMGPPKWDPQNE